MEKYCRTGQDTDDNMTHAHCMLEPRATDTRLECYIYCFPAAKITFFLHCLSSYFIAFILVNFIWA